MLDVRHVTVDFGGRPVLADASLHADDGEVVALLGPSGSGKSTLLRVIAGLTVPRTGTVTLDGTDITREPTHERGIGMVFQDNQLFPHRDVAGNIAFGLRMQHVPASQRDARVAAMLDLVGLAGFGSRRVTDLSGGEAKRVALARSLAPVPRALLLDEPLTGLDRELHDRLAVELGRILRAAGTTTLLVTHDGDEAAVIADRIVTTDQLQGSAPGGRRVVELTAEATHDLRGRVLRTGTPSTEVVFADDEAPTTVHLGLVEEDGTLIAISSWAWRAFPADASGRRAVQLRGMAVDPGVQGTGAGAMLLGAGIERARAEGAEVVWANARDSALGFYAAHGFETVGAGHLDATTAIPHHRIRRLVR